MNKTYITKQRTNTSSIEMAMSMDWYGCSFYTRLGKTAVNSILFAPVLHALLLRNGSLAAKQRNNTIQIGRPNRRDPISKGDTQSQKEAPNPKRRHPISKGGTQSQKEAPNPKRRHPISKGGTQSEKAAPNLKRRHPISKEAPNPKRRHPISKGGTQSQRETPNLKSWYLISEGGTQSQKLIPNLKTIKCSQN